MNKQNTSLADRQHQLDQQLDRELDDTFPASDPPEVTQTRSDGNLPRGNLTVSIDHLKLSSSIEFGAFAQRTFDSISEAKKWVYENIAEGDLDLIRARIDGRDFSWTELCKLKSEIEPKELHGSNLL